METIISQFNTMPPIVFSAAMFVIAYGSAVLFAKLFGESGLYVFISLAIIAANIQVLKTTQFAFFKNPVALGTILFASTYLATDILSEIYGTRAAKKGIAIGFISMLLWTLITFITLSFAPASSDFSHQSMLTLFLPIPAIFIASLASYLISQLNDIYLFALFRKYTGDKKLWLRNNISTLISAFIDSVIFSSLAFFILPKFLGGFHVDFKTLIFTFILGTYAFRVVSALLDTPFMYLAKYILASHNKNESP